MIEAAEKNREYNTGMSEGFYWASKTIEEIQKICMEETGDVRLKVAALCQKFLDEVVS
jgi:hypothetical protein